MISESRRNRPARRGWLALAVAACGSLFVSLLSCQVEAAPLITEFLASNATGLADEDGDRPDWVEICNPDPAPISLDGFFLTDDPNNLDRWRFPNVTLAPGDYLVVFASGKDRALAGADLHASFTLSRPGEYLALVNPDGTTIASDFAPEFPEQYTDISYGHTTAGSVPEGFFERPTPGASNRTAKLSAGKVEFSRSSRTFTTNFRISLTTAVPGATIRYTTDGSLPNSASPQYTTLIPVVRTTQIRAGAFASGALDGPVRTEVYFKLGAEAASHTSDLPIVILDTFGGSVPNTSSTDRQRVIMAIFEPKGEVNPRASLSNPPDLITRGGIRRRGSSSGSFPKYAMSFEAWTENDWEEKTIRPLGMPGEDDWIFNSRYQADRTLMRNPLIFELSRQVGRYAARTRFFELYHDTNGEELSDNDYFGVYTFTEKLDRDADRINVTALDSSIDSEPEITGGYIFKNDRADPGEPTFSTNAFPRALVHVYPDGAPHSQRPNEFYITTAQKNWLRNRVNEIFAAVSRRGGPGIDGVHPTTGKHFSEYIDIDSFIDHHWLNTLMMNIDYGSHSAWFSLDRGGKLQGGPIWDFDRSSGSTIDGISSFDISDPRQWDPPPVPQTWYNRRCQWYGMVLGFWNEWDNPSNIPSTRPDYFQRAVDRWFELRAGPFTTANVHAVIDRMADELRESQARNFARWSERPAGSGQGFEFAAPGLSGYEKEISHLKGWLQAHIEWMDTEFVAPPSFSRSGGAVPHGFGLALTAPEGEIYVTLEGSDPRARGGAISSRAVPFSTTQATNTSIPSETACKYLVPSDGSLGTTWTGRTFDDSSWPDGTSGLGWVFSGPLVGILNTDLHDEARGFNASFYTRFRFDFNNHPQNIISATLKVKYDDGFVAYLNGVEVASGNKPAGLSWNSTSSRRRLDEDSEAFEPFDISAFKNNFVEGTNVLAIHALNSSATGSDMFLLPELEIRDSVAAEPILLTETSEVTARALSGTKWSAPATATFVVGAVLPDISNLAITEIMYRPGLPSVEEANAGFTDRNFFEFLELTNIGTSPVELRGAAFDDGISFHFLASPVTILNPGERILVVNKRAAFEMRYGDALSGRIAGEFADGTRLNNDGEAIRLVGAGGEVIRDFIFNDVPPWPEPADGDGFSLVLVAPWTNPDHGDPASWRASTEIGGNPGTSDHADFVGDPGADQDLDRLSAFLEHALGSDDSDPNSGPERYHASVEILEIEGVAAEFLLFSYRRNLAADDVIHVVDISQDLLTWNSGTGFAEFVSEVHLGDGTTLVTYRSAMPLPGAGQELFMRLRVVGR